MPKFFDTIPGDVYDTPDPYAGQRQEILSRLLREADRPPIPAPQFQPAQTQEQMMETANQLRRNQALGRMFMMSGDPAMGSAGRDLASQDPNQYMMDAARQEQVRKYQQWQADQAAQGGTGRLSALSRSLSALRGEQSGKPPKMPHAAISSVHEGKRALRGVQKALGSFNEEHQRVLGKYQGPLSSVVELTNRQGWEDSLGLVGADKERAKESVLWWAQFQQDVVAPLRHELFGATLTSGEQSAWNAIQAIGPSTDPGTVKQRLRNMEEELLTGNRERAKEYSAAYGKKRIEQMYGDTLDFPYDEDTGSRIKIVAPGTGSAPGAVPLEMTGDETKPALPKSLGRQPRSVRGTRSGYTAEIVE